MVSAIALVALLASVDHRVNRVHAQPHSGTIRALFAKPAIHLPHPTPTPSNISHLTTPPIHYARGNSCGLEAFWPKSMSTGVELVAQETASHQT
ncbi:hypothetical protein B0H17DRAFT_140268 [Mycena rosella]|uniref:Secreted protein n=1 Tax=Mycena rosella TaxID=1033263 RepID=A0AAD7DZ87_MYCRO|nr:hypothetical protein B0H17DRAFT_140268 [Mycena rosella]